MALPLLVSGATVAYSTRPLGNIPAPQRPKIAGFVTSIAEKLDELRSHIHDCERRYGRPENSVQLLAVSKKQDADKIREAYQAGILDFGENYLQEALDKQVQLDDLTELVWHYIGPIQSNKTKGIAGNFHWVHSIDRQKIADRLNEQRDPALAPLNCCVQINVSGEASKSGISMDEVGSLCESIANMERLTLRGLMAIPAPLEEFEAQRACFREMAQCFNQLRARHPTMDTLSMGMSADYEAAIAEGATMIRLGTAIFGPRS